MSGTSGRDSTFGYSRASIDSRSDCEYATLTIRTSLALPRRYCSRAIVVIDPHESRSYADVPDEDDVHDNAAAESISTAVVLMLIMVVVVERKVWVPKCTDAASKESELHNLHRFRPRSPVRPQPWQLLQTLPQSSLYNRRRSATPS